nr:NADH-quinone oxidoreductase subunit C [Prevotella sp.]
MKLENKEFGFDNFASEMAKLKNEKHFDYLVTIIGEDFGEEGLGCIYILENTQTHDRLSVKQIAKEVTSSVKDPFSNEDGNKAFVIPTICNLWADADLLEREVLDFYGIKFIGHPDMRRLYLRNDFKGYPFRKNYDMDPAKNMYTTEDDIEVSTTTEWNMDNDGILIPTAHKMFSDDAFVVNIGPQHPSTHGVLRLETELNGEVVNRIYPHLGYIHRGIEKMCESMTYPQTLALTDRMNYLSAMMHRHALVGVIEEGMGIELSDRIKYVRTIMDELQRIDNHLLYTACCAQDLGALTAFLYGMRDREHVLNVLEETTGGRLIQNYYRIGGLQDDIDSNFVANTKALCKYLRPMVQEYLDVFGDNVITHQR